MTDLLEDRLRRLGAAARSEAAGLRLPPPPTAVSQPTHSLRRRQPRLLLIGVAAALALGVVAFALTHTSRATTLLAGNKIGPTPSSTYGPSTCAPSSSVVSAPTIPGGKRPPGAAIFTAADIALAQRIATHDRSYKELVGHQQPTITIERSYGWTVNPCGRPVLGPIVSVRLPRPAHGIYTAPSFQCVNGRQRADVWRSRSDGIFAFDASIDLTAHRVVSIEPAGSGNDPHARRLGSETGFPGEGQTCRNSD